MMQYIRTLSHAIWVSIFLVLVDGFINVILFITVRGDYQDWCVASASTTINNNVQSSFPNSSVPFNFARSDFYNCDKLWQDEFKFSFIAILLMIVLYVYWAACIHSLSHKMYCVELTKMRLASGDYQGGPMGPAPVMGMPPNPIPPVVPPPPPPMANRPNIIVLNNEKPRRASKKKKRNTTTFSFKTLARRSAVGAESPSTVVASPSPCMLDFKIGLDGDIVHLENYTPLSNVTRKPLPSNEDDEKEAANKTYKNYYY
ncbi:hypothetical protein DFQ28_001150 [Apophysomyces sp. BC1034]|nr:hypothetical protein DFQ30_003750 [Apophysomyces sp. BC1015]KAG0180417.1 hypothetical protein DFQ29_000710 [Apophysomyces sp. BC1021]KAG0190986.1 hypothetical protein DFQ28_001150 [Apophysomyces sp. BC1034]